MPPDSLASAVRQAITLLRQGPSGGRPRQTWWTSLIADRFAVLMEGILAREQYVEAPIVLALH